MSWTALPKGCFTGIDWAPDGASSGFDPYLIWAEASRFDNYAVPAHGHAVDCERLEWLPVAIELYPPHTVEQLVAAGSMWLRVPRVYRDPALALNTAVPTSLQFCTARVRPGFFRQLRPGKVLHALVKRVELGLPVYRANRLASDARQDQSRRWALCSRPTSLLGPRVLAEIDDGMALAHAHFRDDAGRSRVAYYWRQDGLGQGLRPAAMSYGRELTGANIDAAMASCTDANGQVNEAAVYSALGLSSMGRLWPGGRTPYHALDTAVSHGTHVMDLAAGPYDVLARLSNPPLSPDGPPSWEPAQDSASQAPIVAVQLDYKTVQDTSGGSMNVHFLDALMYILARCRPDAEMVVNVSFGSLAGPHDGTSLLEAAMDELIARTDGRLQIVLAAGNSYQGRTHANLTLPAGGARTLDWFIAPDDATPSFVEIWLPPGATGVRIGVTPPDGAASPRLAPGQSKMLTNAHGQPLGAVIFPDRVATGDRGTCALVALQPTMSWRAGEPTAPSGIWTITFEQTGSEAVTLDAYIERDDTTVNTRNGARQSHFEDVHYDLSGNPASFVDDPSNPTPIRRSGNFNDIANGSRTTSVGGTRARDGSWAHYSPRWPDPDATRPERPDVVKIPDDRAYSDECAVLKGWLAAGPRSGAMARLAGTSSAAPQVARARFNAL